jgi:curved DNA-binding protein CbpA
MISAGLRGAAPRALMDGQLRDHPLAELIHEISDARLSGALRLAFERVKAVVYFEAGRVVAAVSNLRAFRLTGIMLKGGVLDAPTLFAVAGEDSSDEEAAAALIRAGLLEESGLRKARERQTAEVLRDVLRRPVGEWNFDPRVRLAAERHTSANVSQLLVEGAREFAPELVSRRMSNDSETLAPVPDALEKLEASGMRLSPSEGFVLSRVYEPTNLRYVLAVSGLPEDETRRAVYALALGGLITRERWPRALPAYVPHQTAAHPAAHAPPVAASSESPRAEAAASEPEAQEAEAPVTVEADPRELMEELLALARGDTHYTVLGVMRSSTAADIKRAYYSHARRLHPDRLRRAADAEERQRIDAAFAKIAQAYDVLKDSKLRASYDLKLEKTRSVSLGDDARPRTDSTAGDVPRAEAPRANADPSAPRAGREETTATAGGAHSESAKSEEAEQKFRQGIAAYAKNDLAAARLLLGEAARLDPRRARYRAHYGRSLARERATRRQAESELLAAIALDALDASFRVMLAELYRDVGLRRKAEAQLERALTLEPSNAEARALTEELRRGDT